MSSLQETTTSALARLDDFSVDDLDFIGQRWPHVSSGHKVILYGVLAAASIPAQGAWASISLIIVPVAASVASAAMGLAMLLKPDESNAPINIDATEVVSTKTIDATAGPVYEPNPFSGPLPARETVAPSNTDGIDLERVQAVLEQRAAKDAGIPVEEYRAARMIDDIDQVIDATPIEIVKAGKQPMDIAKYMAMNPKPTLISAVPRTGKGVVIAQAWREFKLQNPNSIVWVIQPKPHPKETGYWDGVDFFWGEMIEDALGDANEIDRISKKLTQIIKDWRKAPQQKKLLIIDEGVKLQSVLKKWFYDFLVPTVQVEASSGETDNRFLWLVSQSPLVKDIGISTGNRSSLQFLHLQKPGEDENLSMVMGSYKSIPGPEDGLYELSGSPKQAIFYHTGIGEWYPMPAYPVYQSTRELVTAGDIPQPKPEPIYPLKSVWDFKQPAWEFEDEAVNSTPELDAQIESFRKFANEPRYQCVVDFLDSLKDYENGQQLSPSDFGKSSWASRWVEKEGGLKDRKGGTVGVFLKNAVKLGFLKCVDDKYEVTLK